MKQVVTECCKIEKWKEGSSPIRQVMLSSMKVNLCPCFKCCAFSFQQVHNNSGWLQFFIPQSGEAIRQSKANQAFIEEQREESNGWKEIIGTFTPADYNSA